MIKAYDWIEIDHILMKLGGDAKMIYLKNILFLLLIIQMCVFIFSIDFKLILIVYYYTINKSPTIGFLGPPPPYFKTIPPPLVQF